MNLEQGGVVRAVLDTASALAAAGLDVVVLTHDERDRPDGWKPGATGVPHVVNLGPIGGRGRRLSRDQLATVEKLLTGDTVVHLHGAWKLANNQIARRCRERRVPYVLSAHGMLDDWSMSQSRLKKRLYLLMGGSATIEGAAAVHCTADAELAQAKRWLGSNAEAGFVAPNITDLSAFTDLPGPGLARESFGLPDPAADAPPVVLFLSRLHYKKQPETLIRATAVLAERGTACVTLLAGVGDDAYTSSLRDLIQSLGLADRCRLLGMVKGSLKLSLYQAADVFALPTSQENFGLVYTESLACGTPIVATKGTDIWQELQSSGAAEIADATPEAFADAIARLVSDRDALKRRGEEGRRHVFEWLEVDRTTDRYVVMYRTLLAEEGGAA
ncbi:MAG: hypothetical protein CMJ31_02990 [Phycisphaerae bacterium]|nr:hypothetical protein [Phycisphaerae bacterium]